jgi:hypothetical protein
MIGRDSPSEKVRTLIVGGGPAGMALLLAALRMGVLGALVSDGLCLVEAGGELGGGALRGFAVTSDTAALKFLACLDGLDLPEILAVAASGEARALGEFANGGVPLGLVGRFLDRLGCALETLLSKQGARRLRADTRALWAWRDADAWRTLVASGDGSEPRVIESRHLVLAMGADEDPARIANDAARDIPWTEEHASRTVLSGELLAGDGPWTDLIARPRGRALRGVVVGGSHSALAATRILLDHGGFSPDEGGTVSIIHRSPLRATFESPAAARGEGFEAFDRHDVCEHTGRVFPLGGFRLESRELLLRVLGLGERPKETRVALLPTAVTPQATLARVLDEADIIVSALGYRRRGLPIFEDETRARAIPSSFNVDGASRVLDRRGEPIPGLYGLGLAAGFPMAGRFGEPSFRGEANGLAAWQGEIGAELVKVLADDPRGRSA